jgi:hypothetical protein
MLGVRSVGAFMAFFSLQPLGHFQYPLGSLAACRRESIQRAPHALQLNSKSSVDLVTRLTPTLLSSVLLHTEGLFRVMVNSRVARVLTPMSCNLLHASFGY